MSLKRECVEYYVTGREAWQLGVLGFFTRLRGISFAVILALVTMGPPIWWKILPDEIRIKPEVALFAGVVVGWVALFVVLTTIRKHYPRLLETRRNLHLLSHFLRDKYAELMSRINSKPADVVASQETIHFHIFAKEACETIKNCFVSLTNDQTIAIAIKLAVTNKNNEIVYTTVGRSTGLNSDRQKTTYDIPINQGIANFFNNKDGKGVIIYNDIPKAARIHAINLTHNYIHYPDEIKTMMVAPLNSWDGDATNCMIGMLFITSRNNYTFGAGYVDFMLFISDMLAITMSNYVQNLKEIGKMPNRE